MSQRRWMNQVWVRNGVALLGLLLATYLPDMHAIDDRPGWSKLTPYLFLLLLYGWLVFHNRILFERLFEGGKRREYVSWLLLSMVVGSLTMSLTLHYLYGQPWPVAHLVKYYVFTLTGLGVYKLYGQTGAQVDSPTPPTPLPFRLLVDGHWQDVDPASILYVESLENYVRVFTVRSMLISRLTMKQATHQLPDYFLRISRSHLINLHHVRSHQGDVLLIDQSCLPIGRTYKHHVAERLKQQALPNLS